MKKSYIQPEVKGIELQLPVVLAAASPSTDPNPTVNTGGSSNTMDGFDAEFSEEDEN